MDMNFEQANIFGIGQENSGYAQYFSGASFLNPLTDPAKTRKPENFILAMWR